MAKVNIKIQEADKVNGEYSLFITSEYDSRIVDAIRSFPTKWWHADVKAWELPFTSLGKFVDKLSWCEISISGEYVSLEKKKFEMPKGFEFKTKPFEHQMDGFKYGLTNDRWLLGDEQGLGKTKQVIDIAVAKKIEKGYKHCLIICGVNGLKWNWMNEVHTHSNEDVHILGQCTKKGKIVIGSNQDKLSDIQQLDSIDAYFLITNVESLRNEDIAKAIQKRCADGTIGVVAIDEIHKCKDPSSQQGKGILKIQSDVRIAMTGTPLMNQPFDLYIILKWLGYEKHAFYAFKRHYAVYGGFGGYEVMGYQHLDELQEQLDEIMLRRLKKHVLDLPEKIYIDEYVEFTAKQSQIYKEVSMEIKANIDMIKSSPNPLAQLIRLRQATGYTGILSSTITESAKLDRMEELVEETIENGKKVVIFSNWTQITDEAYKRLKKYNPALITGQTDDANRQAQVNKFQNDDKCKVMLGTTGAMGTGLTLTAGTVEIFLDEPWNRALKDQAVDRCHRVGTTENVTIYTLLTRDTIDERIHELVAKKGEMSDALVDGQIKIGKDKIVDFLLS